MSNRQLPPGVRLTTRRGSVSAPDPFGINSEVETSRKIQSRIAIVHAKNVSGNGPGGSPANRRASWATNRNKERDGASGDSNTSSPSGKGRLSFAFSSFTPNSPIIGDLGPARRRREEIWHYCQSDVRKTDSGMLVDCSVSLAQRYGSPLMRLMKV